MVMVLGTYANLYAIEEIHINPTEITEAIPRENLILSNENKMEIQKVVTAVNVPPEKPPDGEKPAKEIRHEPPQPEEPQESVVSAKNPPENEVKPEKVETKPEKPHEKQGPVVEPVLPAENPKPDEAKPEETKNIEKQKKTEDVDIEAIKKEDSELKEQEKSKEDVLKKQLDILKQQNEVQKQIVEQQKQILEVIKQHQEHVSEKEDLEKVKQKKLEAVKQIETIAKQAIESLGGKEDEKKEKPQPVKLVPLPIVVSNNLTIDGKPRQETTNKTVIKENEFNINKVDNMNINIKHEINVNVDSKNNPKNLVELLNGKNKSVEHPRSERSVKDEATKSDFVLKNKSDSPLMEIVNKLSEANMAALQDINVKAPGRDLKYFQAKM